VSTALARLMCLDRTKCTSFVHPRKDRRFRLSLGVSQATRFDSRVNAPALPSLTLCPRRGACQPLSRYLEKRTFDATQPEGRRQVAPWSVSATMAPEPHF
jgi:hypothetical protein